MRSDQARMIPIHSYLEKQGIKPARQRAGGREFWYSSPIRSGDSDPSFKVDTNLNLWYDHGLAKGGNIIDLVIELNQCSVSDALSSLEKSGLYSTSLGRAQTGKFGSRPNRQTSVAADLKPAVEKEKGMSLQVVNVRPLKHPALIQYLEKRGINIQIAQQYASEIDFKALGSAGNYFGIGYPTGDGYEVRNALFKGFVGETKSYSFHQADNPRRLVVFEGFMDFLTYLTVKGNLKADTSALVLNSGNLKTRALPELLKPLYEEIQLFLDNDAMGDVVTEYFQTNVPGDHVVDMRERYAGFDDLNDWHLNRRI